MTRPVRDAPVWRSLVAASRRPRVTVLLGLWFAVMYVGTAQSGQVSADVLAAYLPAWSIGQHGTVDLDGFEDVAMWLRQVDGHWRSDRFPGGILVAVPAYIWFGDPVRATIGPSLLTAGLMAALTVVLVHRTLLRVTTPGIAFAATLVFGLGTPIWTVSADALWTHTSTQLGLALAIYGLASRRPWLSALGMLLSASARPHTAVAGAVLGLGSFLRTRRVGPMLWLAAGTAAGLGLVLWWSGATLGHATLLPGSYTGRGGAVLTAGNAAGDDAKAFGWPVNLAGFLISPERGVLVLCPFLVPCAVGVVRAWRSAPGFAKDGAIAAVVYTVLQLSVNGFGGGWGFYSFRHGLEGLTLATPMLVLGAAAVVRSPFWAKVTAVLVGYAVAVHTLGAVWYVAYNEGPVWWTKFQAEEITRQAPWTAIVSIGVGALVAALAVVLVRADFAVEADGVIDVTDGSRATGVGSSSHMTPTEDNVHARSNLLPEEQKVGSADPEAQAAAILEESEDRVDEPTASPDPDDPRPSHDDEFEHRRSEDTV